MERITTFIQSTLEVAAILGLFYFIPYLVRRGWEDAKNDTRKDCDVCFRDLKKINEIVEKEMARAKPR